jgi:YD repeat-containing protein
MKRALLFAAFVAACNTPASPKLPGGSITPHLDGNPANAACGDDIAYDGDTGIDVSYRYAYDALGRLSHATGTYAVGSADSIDYTWDHLDHMTHLFETRQWWGTSQEIIEDYDALGDLVDYSWHETAYKYDYEQTYAYSSFDINGNPARELEHVDDSSQPPIPDVGYSLDYDSLGRVLLVVADTGSTTTYTYDDSATRTVTIDTDDGANHGVIVYDDQSREQSEAWDGTGSGVWASATQYDWSDSQLLGATFESGTDDAPHVLTTTEVDTLVYDCADVRSTHVPNSHARR